METFFRWKGTHVGGILSASTWWLGLTMRIFKHLLQERWYMIVVVSRARVWQLLSLILRFVSTLISCELQSCKVHIHLHIRLIYSIINHSVPHPITHYFRCLWRSRNFYLTVNQAVDSVESLHGSLCYMPQSKTPNVNLLMLAALLLSICS